MRKANSRLNKKKKKNLSMIVPTNKIVNITATVKVNSNNNKNNSNDNNNNGTACVMLSNGVDMLSGHVF